MEGQPDVFMEQPEGWGSADKPKEEWICRLRKSMYGLPHAHNCSQRQLDATLTEEGQFASTVADDCIYVTPDHNPTAPGYAALGAHVDDMLAVGDAAGHRKIKDTLEKKFKITQKAEPEVITGVQIERNRQKRYLKIHQEAYVQELLSKHDMSDCKQASTPMDRGTARALMLLPTKEHDPAVILLFQALVGALIWLAIKTRPDMLFTVNLLSRFLRCATRRHLDLARGRPLRYLKGTASWGIAYAAGFGAREWVLSGSSDSDLAGDLKTSRSTLGWWGKLGAYGTVLAHCGLDRKISTATGQAETYAMQGLVKDVVWLRTLLAELGFPMKDATQLGTDNDGVFKQSTKTVNHTAAKHYRIAQAYIRQHWRELIIKVLSVNTNDNAADMFTKALNAGPFLHHRHGIMGPQSADELSIQHRA